MRETKWLREVVYFCIISNLKGHPRRPDSHKRVCGIPGGRSSVRYKVWEDI